GVGEEGPEVGRGVARACDREVGREALVLVSVDAFATPGRAAGVRQPPQVRTNADPQAAGGGRAGEGTGPREAQLPSRVPGGRALQARQQAFGRTVADLAVEPERPGPDLTPGPAQP